MYLGLFLAPWMLMYALSTMAMNHRRWFRPEEGAPVFRTESVTTYAAAFPAGAAPEAIARQILRDIGLEGTHTVSAPRDRSRITILRQDPFTPRRIVYTPSDRKLVVEKESFRMPAFLERMHRRRGYLEGFVTQRVWAASVDLAIIAMIFWAASGIWMWWEMKRTRLLGGLLALAGCLLFGFFVLTI
jgi:hypothetical protein